jgi:carbamoyl-phosphate synthase large subunit
MRVLITDPFHPVVPATVLGLKERARAAGEEWTVLGLASRSEGARPPALDGLIAGPDWRKPRWQDLVALAGSSRIDVLLPWTDLDPQGIARYADPLAAAGISVACAPAPLVELAADKWATTLRLAELGVPVPETRLVRTAGEVEKAAVDLGYPQAPLLLKPRDPAGGQGVWSIRAGVDLTRTSPRPRLPLAAVAAAVAGSEERVDFLLQQELAGTDLSVDVLAHRGRVVAAGVRTRQRTLGGLCVQGSVLPTFPGLDEVISCLVGGLGWSHLANVQLIADPARGTVTVYEINARAAGSIGITAHAGLDLLHAAITYAQTGAVPPVPATVPNPIGFRRHWTDEVWML